MENQVENLDDELIESVIRAALSEDIKNGDITTDLIIPFELNAKAYIKAKSEGIIAGLKIAEKVFKLLEPDIGWRQNCNDGDRVKNGEVIAYIDGSFKAILTGERTALNFLQRMSGIATETSKYVAAVKHTKAKILDSRKTVPGLRMLDKYSVKMGGGTNHRIGLFDMVLIKDNHIKVAGGIAGAVEQVKLKIKPGIKIEVEASDLDEVNEALIAGANIIMLDNMSNEMMKQAVDIVGGKAFTEASGNMSLERVKEVAETGVDYISVGALTHSVKALDIAQYIEKAK